MKEQEKVIGSLRKQIEVERQKVAQDGEREKIKETIEQAKKEYGRAEAAHKEAHLHHETAKEAEAAHLQATKVANQAFEQITNKISETEAGIKSLEAAMKGGVNIYGRGMPNILQAISRAKWTGPPPLGPLGLHVKVKDSKWREVLRLGVGNLLGNFVVTNYKDRTQLKGILEKNGA